MRTRASAPLTAPTPQQWRTLWSGLVDLARREVDEGARLVAGEAWQPGARWDLTPPGLTRGTAEASVRRSGKGRAVTLTYREHGGGTRTASLDADGLEEPLAASSSGTLDPLVWTGKASMTPAGPGANLQVTLPWGRLRLRARVVGDRLDTELVVRGRGVWRPPAAVGLRVVRAQVGEELQRATGRLAEEVSRVAQDPGAVVARQADAFQDDALGDARPEDARAPDAGTGGTIEGALDLGWLRDPLTVLRRLRGGGRDRR